MASSTASLEANEGEQPSKEQGRQEEEEEVFKLAPFNPSSLQIQSKALELFRLNDDDILFDLGCGDGRFLVAAAQQHPGLKCVGVEIDPIFANRAKEHIETLPDDIKNRIHIRQEDVLKLPMTPRSSSSSDDDDKNLKKLLSLEDLTLIDDATALYLFILPKGVNKIMPLLEAILAVKRKQKRILNFRVVSYMFKIHDWEPTIKDTTSKAGCPVYLYEFNNNDGDDE